MIRIHNKWVYIKSVKQNSEKKNSEVCLLFTSVWICLYQEFIITIYFNTLYLILVEKLYNRDTIGNRNTLIINLLSVNTLNRCLKLTGLCFASTIVSFQALTRQNNNNNNTETACEFDETIRKSESGDEGKSTHRASSSLLAHRNTVEPSFRNNTNRFSLGWLSGGDTPVSQNKQPVSLLLIWKIWTVASVEMELNWNFPKKDWIYLYLNSF